MTDLTVTSFAHLRSTFQLPRLPLLGLGQKLDGLGEALSTAHHMVFASPPQGERPQRAMTESAEAGRDPSW